MTDRHAANGIPNTPTAELLAHNREILHELYRRGVIRTLNAPAGDWAELLVARAYNGALAPNSEKSFDVTTPIGRRLQVKARVVNPANVGSNQLSAIRTWDFDACIIVLLSTNDLTVVAASEVPVDTLRDIASFQKHTNSWTVQQTPAVMASGLDITSRLRIAANDL